MRVYLDSSAIVKRAVREAETAALSQSMQQIFARGDFVFSSALATVEVGRSLRSRLENESPQTIATLSAAALGGISECAISSQVVGVALRLGPPSLRSLDAIHLATASIVAADVVIAYDRRLLRAAEELGFRTLSPGA